MGIKTFTERVIRRQILKKLKPEISRGRSPHTKGWIILEGKKVFRIKIPNDHKNYFFVPKARRLAHSMGLDDKEFNDLIDCPLSRKKYFNLLRTEPHRLKVLKR